MCQNDAEGEASSAFSLLPTSTGVMGEGDTGLGPLIQVPGRDPAKKISISAETGESAGFQLCPGVSGGHTCIGNSHSPWRMFPESRTAARAGLAGVRLVFGPCGKPEPRARHAQAQPLHLCLFPHTTPGGGGGGPGPAHPHPLLPRAGGQGPHSPCPRGGAGGAWVPPPTH